MAPNTPQCVSRRYSKLNGKPRQPGLLPIIEWLRDYQRQWIAADVLAGLVAAAVIIPKAMAYSTIADLPLQAGLYTAFIPMVIYALLGTSRVLSVSTTTTIAILTAAEMSKVAPDGKPGELLVASATLAVLVGAMLIVASVLRFGFVANFISDPVLAGFKAGIGVVIVVDQLPKLLGIHIHKTGLLRDLVAIFQQLPQTSRITLAVALAMFVLMIALERLVPRAPTPLIAVAVGIAASAMFALQQSGVATVGNIPRGFPQLVWPNLSLVAEMWPGAAGLALMSFAESIASARAFARPGERPSPNQELFALGAANIGGGLFGAMPGGGGASQTAVNSSAGARTQIAELVTAAATVATLLLLAPLISLMPSATLAAVVVVYSAGLIKPAEFRDISRVRNTEFYWAVIAFAGVALLGTLRGILVAVIASLLALAQQAYNPPVYALGRKRNTHVFRPLSSEHPDDETFPGMLLARVEGRVFFANAHRVGDKIWPLIEQTRPAVLVLDCSSVIDIEYTALKMLAEADENLRRQGITLWLAALNPNVFTALLRSRIGQALGRERMFFNLQTAVERYQQARVSNERDQAIANVASKTALRKVM